ncbi:MAG: type IV toxin-antitoxin system AbiEi family antitoxin domain-containing protein [Eggerthellaceae bacterium]|nr:type IV toxin-antitoxin system AbiEi family antitoxin domain-containing protein [Eggerthellaceae bacterium]
MTKFDDIIYEIAADNFGLITSSQARAAGVTNNELVQYARRGRIERVGQGVYRLTRRIPEPNDPYALAVALVGPDAFLYGEAVLGMLELCPTNPAYLHVATPHRVRKSLPGYIRLVHTPGETAGAVYDGVPSQSVADAIRAARASVMRGRLEEAVERARQEGYLLADDAREIARELEVRT